jgi:hypothetical protein
MVEISKAMTPLTQRLEQIEVQVQTAEIATDEDLGKAADLTKYIQTQLKVGDEKRLEFTRPLDEQKATVMNFWNPIKKRLEKAKADLGKKITAYQVEAEKRKREEEAERRRIEEEQALERAEQLESEGKTEAASAVMDIATKEAPKKKTAPKRGAMASSSIRTRWVFEVEDESKVPREYLIVDSALVRKAVDAGAREIPGIRIYEEHKAIVR